MSVIFRGAGQRKLPVPRRTLSRLQREILDLLADGWRLQSGRIFPAFWLFQAHDQPTRRLHTRTGRALLRRLLVREIPEERSSVYRTYELRD